MRYFPVFLDASELNCLVVGAGEVAARKIELLLKSPARVTVVAPDICSTVAALADHEQVELIQRAFVDADLDDKDVVFVATSDSELNASIHHKAKAQKILVNVVDNTPLCSFITPSIVDRFPPSLSP